MIKPDYYVVRVMDHEENVLDTRKFISKDKAESYAENLRMNLDLHTKVVGIWETIICEYEV